MHNSKRKLVCMFCYLYMPLLFSCPFCSGKLLIAKPLVLTSCLVCHSHFHIRLVPMSLLTARILFHFRGNPQRIDVTTANRRVTFTYEQVSLFLFVYLYTQLLKAYEEDDSAHTILLFFLVRQPVHCDHTFTCVNILFRTFVNIHVHKLLRLNSL